jgi:uncharacterized protein
MTFAATASDVVYADASALVKAIVEEPESGAVRAYLRSKPVQLVSSKLVVVELERAVRIATASLAAEAAVVGLLAPVALIAVTGSILDRARRVEPALLRTLDAIHLATALEAGAGRMLVYDTRLAGAAVALGMEIIVPQ